MSLTTRRAAVFPHESVGYLPSRTSHTKTVWPPVRRILRWLLRGRRRFLRAGNAGVAGISINPSNSQKRAPTGATHELLCWAPRRNVVAATHEVRPGPTARFKGFWPFCGWPILSPFVSARKRLVRARGGPPLAATVMPTFPPVVHVPAMRTAEEWSALDHPTRLGLDVIGQTRSSVPRGCPDGGSGRRGSRPGSRSGRSRRQSSARRQRPKGRRGRPSLG